MAIEENQFDLIFMDVEMPGLNGLETTRRIRVKSGIDRHVRIIGLTAGALESVRQACLEAGMDGFLAKPITPEKIEACIAGDLK